MIIKSRAIDLSHGEKSYIDKKVALISLAIIVISIFCYNVFGLNEASYGIWSLLPAAVVVTMAIYTKRTVESLFVGVIVGLLMTESPAEFIPSLSGIFLTVFQNDIVAWIFIACGLMGSMIALVSCAGALMLLVIGYQKK